MGTHRHKPRKCTLEEICAQLERCNWLLLSTYDGKLMLQGYRDEKSLFAYRTSVELREPLLAWIDGEDGKPRFIYQSWRDTPDDRRYGGAMYVKPTAIPKGGEPCS